MADKDTLALDPAGPINGSEQVAIVQDGESRRLDIGSIAALAEDPEAVFGAKWELVHHWQWSTNVPEVVFPDLGAYQEILVIGRDITITANSFRHFVVSTDNGATWFNTSGDYITVATNGTIANRTDLSGHATSNAGARTVFEHIVANIHGVPKLVRGTESNMLFVASLNVINAIKMININSGNFTGGELFILGLR